MDIVEWLGTGKLGVAHRDHAARAGFTPRAVRDAACSQRVNGLSDSGLETIFVYRLSAWGLRIRQQIHLAGHPVDVLIGERLVVQIDGYAFHSSSAQRTRDVAHDAELRLRGYEVLLHEGLTPGGVKLREAALAADEVLR